MRGRTTICVLAAAVCLLDSLTHADVDDNDVSSLLSFWRPFLTASTASTPGIQMTGPEAPPLRPQTWKEPSKRPPTYGTQYERTAWRRASSDAAVCSSVSSVPRRGASSTCVVCPGMRNSCRRTWGGILTSSTTRSSFTIGFTKMLLSSMCKRSPSQPPAPDDRCPQDLLPECVCRRDRSS